ncbi:MAG: hypothetical protein S0880_12700, partial [Actinomycetota bacterium]|nr:hypothetical protein [Actinomycetota bacterium]
TDVPPATVADEPTTDTTTPADNPTTIDVTGPGDRLIVHIELTGIDWSLIDLSSIDWDAINWSGIDLSQIELDGADLTEVDLEPAADAGVSVMDLQVAGLDIAELEQTGLDLAPVEETVDDDQLQSANRPDTGAPHAAPPVEESAAPAPQVAGAATDRTPIADVLDNASDGLRRVGGAPATPVATPVPDITDDESAGSAAEGSSAAGSAELSIPLAEAGMDALDPAGFEVPESVASSTEGEQAAADTVRQAKLLGAQPVTNRTVESTPNTWGRSALTGAVLATALWLIILAGTTIGRRILHLRTSSRP